MSDERSEALSSPGEPASERPSGLPDAKSEARRRTPLPDDEPAKREKRISLLPPQGDAPAKPSSSPSERPPGLVHMTTSVRRRLMLVLDDDSSQPDGALDPKVPPKVQPPPPGLDEAERAAARSLGRWVAFTGLMTLTVGALTGLSYFTHEQGTVAQVVIGILASALAFWLLGAARAFHRVASPKAGMLPRHHLLAGFSLLRSALLLKAVLLFAALALGCVTFSLVASLLFLL